MISRKSFLAFLFLFFVFSAPWHRVEADDTAPIELGQEYSEHSRGAPAVSAGRKKTSFFRVVLLYLPNRVLDLIDIPRIDAGVGFSTGAVVRATRWGQVGYRVVSPVSLRVGLRGRHLPVFLERSSEFGAGPAFLQSADREVTPVELGVGADLFLAGVYAGLSLDQLVDFIGGFVGLDPADDDLR